MATPYRTLSNAALCGKLAVLRFAMNNRIQNPTHNGQCECLNALLNLTACVGFCGIQLRFVHDERRRS